MFSTGCAAVSLAGRDKNTYYAVVNADDIYVYVCDGKHHSLDNPKRKNPKHIMAVGVDLTKEQMASDRTLRKALATIKAAGK